MRTHEMIDRVSLLWAIAPPIFRIDPPKVSPLVKRKRNTSSSMNLSPAGSRKLRIKPASHHPCRFLPCDWSLCRYPAAVKSPGLMSFMFDSPLAVVACDAAALELLPLRQWRSASIFFQCQRNKSCPDSCVAGHEVRAGLQMLLEGQDHF